LLLAIDDAERLSCIPTETVGTRKFIIHNSSLATETIGTRITSNLPYFYNWQQFYEEGLITKKEWRDNRFK
jgi:hypothetical protein